MFTWRSVRSVCGDVRSSRSVRPFIRFFLNFCTFASREEGFCVSYGRRSVRISSNCVCILYMLYIGHKLEHHVVVGTKMQDMIVIGLLLRRRESSFVLCRRRQETFAMKDEDCLSSRPFTIVEDSCRKCTLITLSLYIRNKYSRISAFVI